MSDPTPTIPYGRLMHEAVCGVIREVLDGVARDGLPGDHHFFITFDTRHGDVELADWLQERFPEEMMIVVQNWFDDLSVDDDGFSITLNFGDVPERMRIPFDSLTTFVDPSVEFAWRFERIVHDDEDPTPPEDPETPDPGDDGDDAGQEAEVVSLDTFRRNH